MRVKSKVSFSLPVSFGQPSLKCFDNPVELEFFKLQVDLWVLHLAAGSVVDPTIFNWHGTSPIQ